MLRLEWSRKALPCNEPRKVTLPADIIDRPKTGFGTPVKEWLQRDDRLQGWRQVPRLASQKCPWARRWAYPIGRRLSRHAKEP